MTPNLNYPHTSATNANPKSYLDFLAIVKTTAPRWKDFRSVLTDRDEITQPGKRARKPISDIASDPLVRD